MRDFNLEETKAGAPVCIESGLNADIYRFPTEDNPTIWAFVEHTFGGQKVYMQHTFPPDGKCVRLQFFNIRPDLKMKEEKKCQD